jgi:hypothetical protein
MSTPSVVSLDQARHLKEARKVLKHCAAPVIWTKTVQWYSADFGVTVRIELSRDLVLRVTNPKTGEVLGEGSALAPVRD